MGLAWLIGCGGWKPWGLHDGLLALMLAQWQSAMLQKLSAMVLAALSGSEQNWVAPPGRRRPPGLAGAGSAAIPAWAIDNR